MVILVRNNLYVISAYIGLLPPTNALGFSADLSYFSYNIQSEISIVVR